MEQECVLRLCCASHQAHPLGEHEMPLEKHQKWLLWPPLCSPGKQESKRQGLISKAFCPEFIQFVTQIKSGWAGRGRKVSLAWLEHLLYRQDMEGLVLLREYSNSLDKRKGHQWKTDNSPAAPAMVAWTLAAEVLWGRILSYLQPSPRSAQSEWVPSLLPVSLPHISV